MIAHSNFSSQQQKKKESVQLLHHRLKVFPITQPVSPVCGIVCLQELGCLVDWRARLGLHQNVTHVLRYQGVLQVPEKQLDGTCQNKHICSKCTLEIFNFVKYVLNSPI